MINSRKITLPMIIGYTLILAFVIGLFPIVLTTVYRLHIVTEKLLNHPFKVNSAALDMETTFLNIRHKMLEISLSRDKFKIGQISLEIDLLEKNAREDLEIVKTAFLGNMHRVHELENMLDLWKTIRAEIIDHALKGELHLTTQLYSGKGKDTFMRISAITDYLILFSKNKAANYVIEANQITTKKFYLIGTLFSILIFTIAITGVLMLRRANVELRNEEQFIKELEISENKFHTLFETTMDCLLITDINGYILDINRNGHTRLKYSKDEIIGKHISLFVSPKFNQSVPERISRMLMAGYIIFESEHLCKDGTIFPIEVSAQVIEQNGEKRIFSINRDITERKRMEQILTESEAKYRAIIETSLDGFLIINLQGEILEANNAYIKRSGFTHQELLTMRFWDLAAKENIEKVMAHIHKTYREGHHHYEAYHETKDGGIWPVEITTSFWEASDKLIFVVIHDFTERKKQLTDLEDSERKFRFLFENADDEMMIIDVEGIIVDINYSGHQQLGYTREEMVGKPLSRFISDKAIKNSPQIIEKILSQGSLTFESENVRKDGSVIVLEVNAKAIEQRGEKYFFSLARDITKRKEFEEILAKREAKYRAIIETSADGFWITDIQGRFLEVNEAYISQSGYSREELLQMHIADIEANEKPEETLGHIAKILKEGYDLFETLHRRKDGSVWAAEIHVNFFNIDNGLLFVFIHDITERKRQIAELEDSERRFRVLYENANDGMHILDMNAVIVDINRKGYTRLGYTKEEMVGKKVTDFVPERISKNVGTLVAKLMNEGQLTFESAHICKDGTEMPMEINAQIIEQGSQKYIFSVNRDITLRKEIENMLAKRESKYRAVIETSADGFWMVDLEGNILEVNDAYLHQSGYTREEIIGHNISLHAPRLTQAQRAAHIQKVIKEKHDRFESYHVKKDGTTWPVEVIANYWDIGDGRIFCFIMDISERKRMMKVLEESESKFRLLFENANDILLIADMNGCIADINPASLQNLGYSKEEIIGKPLENIVAPEFAGGVSDRFAKVKEAGAGIIESAYRRKDGTIIPVEINIKIIEKEGEKIAYSIARDITKQKSELEKMKSREAISRAVIERILDS